MRSATGFAFAAVLAFAGMSASAQSLSVDDIFTKVSGSWSHAAGGVGCGDGAVRLQLSPGGKSVTISNWPAGANKTYDARRVVSIQKRGQADQEGVLPLIDMASTPPDFRALTMPHADTISIKSQTRPNDPAAVFTRCPAKTP